MGKTTYLISILLLAFVIIGVTFFLGLNNSSNNDASIKLGTPVTGQSGSDSSSSGITLAELAKHNTENDCWVGFQGKAYDITSWLPKHPINTILPNCGTAKEFEDAFTKKHGTSKVSLFMKVATYMGDIQDKGNLQ
ncbi:MAG: cytochrome b5-like heme/steroid binding domain-containing protein [Nanoarchaeota archaeon]|nr:cytochrome b5-like heme/steroid binding domain-containing protein [Nanoarchaeota archaeon]